MWQIYNMCVYLTPDALMEIAAPSSLAIMVLRALSLA
jgi:hypothetical protein